MVEYPRLLKTRLKKRVFLTRAAEHTQELLTLTLTLALTLALALTLTLTLTPTLTLTLTR